MSKEEDVVEIKCPECGAVVRVPREVAEHEMKTKCPSGHEIQLFKALE